LADHVTTVLWALAGDATVEGRAADLVMNIQRLWLHWTVCTFIEQPNHSATVLLL